MKRDEAERLFSHHYRLYSQIRAVVDTSPPFSMYNSPKSRHYRPSSVSSVTRRSHSVEPLNRREGGRSELAQFLQRPSTGTGSRTKSFNRYSSGSMLNLSAFNPPKPPPLDLSKIGSKVRQNRNYQPPKRKSKPDLPRPNSKSSSQSFSSSPSEMTPKPRPEIMVPTHSYDRSYEETREPVEEDETDPYENFKNAVLDEILVRGVYSDRVIKDAFAHEMEKQRGLLSMRRMKKVMLESFEDLGVEMDNEADFRRRTILAFSDLYPYESSPKSENSAARLGGSMEISTRSSASANSSSSSKSTSSHSSAFGFPESRHSPSDSLTSNSSFALDAKPPSTFSSSSSELIEFPGQKRGADRFDLPDRELSLSSDEDEFPDHVFGLSDLSEVIERARSLDLN
ncbi:hypothetical protein L596_012073 [Steinernema carpocapsae]|uniref:Uncharacterized protein n=1 Tax=Steinernema carpocapsae TaxID=34508 RepID=A0A4U5NVY4_STECR|nr:hypothetical protein L596_012073 [Steinernema carpocapsae]